ncbi:MAG: bis-aminopropyl spermidine synthase family protein [Thermosediminibacteraceae bacterium]|nr:bis-aminopropyl spermidine synthase family protein [Thermosediminibacteraceae bacterium]
MDIKQLAQEVYKRTNVETTARDVEKVLAGLASSSHFWEVVCAAQKPFSVVAEIVGVLKSEGLVSIDEEGDIHLTQEGMEFLKSSRITPRKDFTCQACEGRGIGLEKLKELIQKFDELTTDRPKAIIDYDQGYITTHSVISRVALMAERGDLQGKKLLVLGDDDLLSLAASLSGMPAEVVVLEIDDRLVGYINEKASKLGLPVKAIKYDFREKLPEEYVGYFDTFNTDPPETIEALEVCMTRGLTALSGEGCAGYFGLTRTEASLKKWNQFQQMLVNKFKVAITDIIDNFNHYVNWDYLLGSIRDDYTFVQVKPRLNWYRSSMYRIETLSGFERLENKPMPCELYVDEEALIYRPDRKR